jgi:rhodanese-related sulfurtransferase
MLDVEISPAETARFLRLEDARLVDVREPWEFAAMRIEGSLHIPI